MENMVFIKAYVDLNETEFDNLSQDELYDGFRGIWRMSKDRVKDLQYAFAIHDGIIKCVYKIDKWHEANTTKYKTRTINVNDPKLNNRLEFTGKVAQDMQHFIGQDVSQYYTRGEANPIKYMYLEKLQEDLYENNGYLKNAALNDHNDNWTTAELEAAVAAYIDMRQKDVNGEPYTKKAYYIDLANRFGRSEKSYEYRMQNISYIYSLLGRDWLSGLKPARNVGARVAGELEALINKIEGQKSTPVAEFESTVKALRQKKSKSKPSGNTNPQKTSTEVTQYIRDPAVVAWVLNEAKGVCENCDCDAPFVKEDGIPFLEVHHLRRLADGGSDTTSNAIAVCPNCHRELHYGLNRVSMLKDIYSKIDRLIDE